VGYPFAASFDELPAADARVRGIGVFAGLFRARRDADAYARTLRAGVVPLATPDEFARRAYPGSGSYDDFAAHVQRVVEMAAASPAYAEADLEQVEHELDERLAREWTKLPGQQTRRAAALSKLVPLCTVGAGRVYLTNEHALFAFRRTYAPVTCDDGRNAWVPWRATRLESAVVGERVHQVVLVECDVPTVEVRAVGAPPAALGVLSDGRCD